MSEEFQESEVIFVQDHHDSRKTTTCDEEDEGNQYLSEFTRHKLSTNNTGESRKKTMPSSVPANIPDTGLQFGYRDDNEQEEDGELVPPHVIVGRRIAGQMAFSVCTGNGRTLKGRDLSQVRNSILRMTGFLEA